MLRPLDPTPLTAPLAPYAAKALLAAGDAEMARGWYDMAAQSGRPEVLRQIVLLWPLQVMYDKKLLNQAQKARWLEVVNQMPNGRARAARVLAILDALGYSVGEGEVTNVAGTAGGGDPAVLQQLSSAAAGKRVGETVALSLIALGREGIAAADPSVVAAVIRSLRRAGLELEARAAAREAIAAAIS